jgi:hypothetical protein
VFNATTHAGAERALQDPTIPVRRLGSRGFAALIGLELVLVVGVLVWALVTLLPTATPLAATGDLAPVQRAIKARIVGEIADPIVAVGPEIGARASNLRGLSLNGATYYYFIEGTSNYDPLSRGAVGQERVEILLRDSSGPSAFVIYRIL